MQKNRLVHLSIIGIFVSLYFLVATISMINSVAFFDLAHSGLMNWALAIGFEIGAAASLAAIVILDKTNKTMVWGLFLLLTSFQMMANSFHAFINLENYMGWVELFGLGEAEPLYQKRILSIVSGAILPLVALGFIKSLVDYVRPAAIEPTVKDDFSDLDVTLNDGLEELEKGEESIHQSNPYPTKETPPAVFEEQLGGDLYSRDAIIAKIPVEVGEVHIAPETFNAVADFVEKPIPTVQTTPVGDPIIIPTNTQSLNTEAKKPPLTARPFVRSVSTSVQSKP